MTWLLPSLLLAKGSTPVASDMPAPLTGDVRLQLAILTRKHLHTTPGAYRVLNASGALRADGSVTTRIVARRLRRDVFAGESGLAH